MLYDWPPNSPDLSPIEILREILKKCLTEINPQPINQDELEQCLTAHCDDLEQDLIDDLARTFQYRIKMCKDIFGARISHFLSRKDKPLLQFFFLSFLKL